MTASTFTTERFIVKKIAQPSTRLNWAEEKKKAIMKKLLCKLFGHKGYILMTEPTKKAEGTVFNSWIFVCKRCPYTEKG